MRLTLATRRSALALAQARAWAETLVRMHPGLTLEERHITTSGDRVQDRPLYEIGGKGLFLKEIEEALLAREADLAVHSVKDVPAELAPGLVLAAVPPREDPRDAWVSRSGASFDELPSGSKVGTSSLRRVTLLRAARPDLVFVPLRGNVDTRLRKVSDGEIDAIVLAMAGLVRLGRAAEATHTLDPAVSLPAVGQGALGIECRAADDALLTLLRVTHDPETGLAVSVERGVMAAVGGSCRTPVAAYVVRDADGRAHLRAMLADEDGSNARFVEERASWPSTDADARAWGLELGARLLR